MIARANPRTLAVQRPMVINAFKVCGRMKGFAQRRRILAFFRLRSPFRSNFDIGLVPSSPPAQKACEGAVAAPKVGEERFTLITKAGPGRPGHARAAAVPPRPQPLGRRPEAFLEGEPSVSDDLSPCCLNGSLFAYGAGEIKEKIRCKRTLLWELGASQTQPLRRHHVIRSKGP